MFDHLNAMPEDPILGLMAAFRKDPREQKIDLGVGVYQNNQGQTPVMRAVQQAEDRLIAQQLTKTYQGIAGDADYNQRVLDLLLGADHEVQTEGRTCSIQTPGGSGALRIGAEVIRRANPDARLWVGVPTWPNHIPLLGSAGFQIEQYPYYDRDRHCINFDAMLDTLKQVPAGDIVLLHGCCHNPTGADLNRQQWQQITELAQEKGFIPFIDIAYQGLGDGLDEDAYGLRLMASHLPELVIASSCSKNFGLYRERTGSTSFVCNNSERPQIVLSQAMSIARQTYSMPPAHGALLVSMILGDEILESTWHDEVNEVRHRIQSMRTLLTDGIQNNATGQDFSHIKQQKGMFSFLGISNEQLASLREDYGIYIVDSTRINLAGINSGNIGYLCESILKVLAV
ncbi:MAG: aspartate/tyrosine/aromatic aminotransferase [Gammaproteobacteria bacterium]|nr:aspartate/tyrosine/aromatic aminotransferase [Gammaproteobacteria bacterium]